jgi:hypothetical protein
MVNEREEIRREVLRIAGGRPVRWTDERTSLGDFPGRDWALEVFDVPAAEYWDLHHRLSGLRWKFWDDHHRALTILFHTPEETTRLYSWVRQEHEAEMAGAT